jgi:hypothetical protein
MKYKELKQQLWTFPKGMIKDCNKALDALSTKEYTDILIAIGSVNNVLERFGLLLPFDAQNSHETYLDIGDNHSLYFAWNKDDEEDTDVEIYCQIVSDEELHSLLNNDFEPSDYHAIDADHDDSDDAKPLYNANQRMVRTEDF